SRSIAGHTRTTASGVTANGRTTPCDASARGPLFATPAVPALITESSVGTRRTSQSRPGRRSPPRRTPHNASVGGRILLSRHAVDDAADAEPAAEVLSDAGDHRWLPAGRVAETQRRQHRELDAAALGEAAGRHSISSSARASTEGGIVRPRAF